MKVNDFKSEVFFEKHEFSAPYLLSQSDAESMTIKELLDYEPWEREKFLNTWLGYTEVPGAPDLRAEISKLYKSISVDEIIVHAGAEEAIFNFMRVMLEKGDHMIAMFPAYQSAYDVASAVGAEVTRWWIKAGKDEWLVDFGELEKHIRPNTKVIYVNSPNNPTGFVFTEAEICRLVEIAKKHDIYILSDEVYHGLELDGVRRPLLADLYDKAVSVNVMSKAYGFAGLRIGWTATKDKYTCDKLTKAKHYTTVCNSAPSEFLATLALRNSEQIIARNLKILRDNMEIADKFFAKYPKLFEYRRLRGGTIGFLKMNIEQPIDDFCVRLVNEKGVLLLSAGIFDTEEQYFRMGFGRRNFAEALGKFEEYLIEEKIV